MLRTRPAVGMLTQDLLELFAEQWLGAVDGARGMDSAGDHLIKAHGRRRIAFIQGPVHHSGAHERYRGYLDAAHLGLDGMRERTRRLGGTFTVDSLRTTSTTVRAVLPGILRRPAAPPGD